MQASWRGILVTRMLDRELLNMAWNARERAHAPYSDFKVGAAILAGSESSYAGCNVENAAYPQGLCAEAGAIAAMIAGGDSWIAKIAVVADSPEPVVPCGGCRQKIAEFADGGTKIVMANRDATKVVDLRDLLPYAFGAESLGKKETD